MNVYLGYSAGYDVNGSGNVMIGYHAGPNNGSLVNVDSVLYIHNTSSSNPLIYGEFDNQILRINGRLDTENGTIFMRNLGTNDTNQGIKWGESNDLEAFGIIYDGQGLVGNNRLHMREYITGSDTDIMTYKADGNVGVGIADPDVTLHIKDVAKLEPQSTEPTCDNSLLGSIYYNATTNRVRICTMLNGPSATYPDWKDLHDNTPD